VLLCNLLLLDARTKVRSWLPVSHTNIVVYTRALQAALVLYTHRGDHSSAHMPLASTTGVRDDEQ
jgi:hypothetical protein